MVKNYWLDLLRVGRKVKYVGGEAELKDKVGVVKHVDSSYVDVNFEGVPEHRNPITVDRNQVKKVAA